MSASNSRRMGGRLTGRCTHAEEELVAARAKQAGMTVSAYIRSATLGYKPPPSRVDQKAFANAVWEFGKAATNINQLAKQANAGRYQESTIEYTLRELQDAVTRIMQAAGLARKWDGDE